MREGFHLVANLKIGLTGLPGAGKTTAVLKIIEMLKQTDDELTIGGMINEPVLKDKRIVGFSTMNLANGDTAVFGSTKFESKFTVGNIGFDFSKLDEVGVQAIRQAINESDVIVIDEVGKIEVESQAFVDIVKEAVEAEKPMLITLHKKSRNPLLQDIRRRDDVRLLDITPTNRNLLPHKIVRLMNGEIV